VLKDGRRRGKNHVRRGRGDDDQVDVFGAHAGGLKGLARSLDAEVAGTDFGSGEVASPDAGSLDDPLVRRFHSLAASSAARSALVTRRGGR
jgi:hypothetical protein